MPATRTARLLDYFYPRPPRGGRPGGTRLQDAGYPDFYPRPPRGGRPGATKSTLPCSVFLSTPSARRATNKGSFQSICQNISIHALREEGDLIPYDAEKIQRISIHALREEGDQFVIETQDLSAQFLSTPSARRATEPLRGIRQQSRISIHALREEGDHLGAVQPDTECDISIHALREEGDLLDASVVVVVDDFYPRPPRGGRHSTKRPASSKTNFYPRPPRGGRRAHTSGSATKKVFLSTPSARRATPQKT